MKKKILCVLLGLVLALGAGCTPTQGTAEQQPQVRQTRSAVYDSFAQPELALDSKVFDGDGALCAMSFGGVMGQRMTNLMNRWMYTAYYSNSGMIEQFRQRESALRLGLMPWYGEFPGKYITSIALMYELNHDENLRRVGDEVTAALAEVQGEDGYLGVFSRSDRMLGAVTADINGSDLVTVNWDMWNHYHIIRGLLAWYEQTGNETAYETARKAADFIIGYFDGAHDLTEVGEADKNLSILPVYVKLYTMTGEEKYLEFANELLAAWQGANGGDFFRKGLNGVPYNGLTQKRWETMHALLGIAEVYELTGEEEYRSAFLNLYHSLREYDRHNSGGVMTGEQAVGSPYREGSVETCATVAWLECSVWALKMTGDSRIADELELSTLNGVLGAQSPSGRSFTYSTPDEGVRLASSTELSFQAVAGSPELNCCAVSGPSGLGLISKWALLGDEAGITLNYYGESVLAAHTPSGGKLLLTEETAYPKNGAVTIEMGLEAEEAFTLRLRIPAWAADTAVTVNGENYPCTPGSYCEITRTWTNGDRIGLTLDMVVHFWAGGEARTDSAAIYYGPLLLAYDERFNHNQAKEELSAVPLTGMTLTETENENVPAAPEPIVLFRAEFGNGTEMVLCDFAAAGHAGTNYTSWIPVTDADDLTETVPGENWLAVLKEATR